MNNVVKKCPKDGIVYNADYIGTCGSCFGPLKFFCKLHSDWLDSGVCPKCDPAAATAPVAPTPSTPPIAPAPLSPPPMPSTVSNSPSDRNSGIVFGVMVLACFAVIGVAVYFMWRMMAHPNHRNPKPLSVTFTPPPSPPAQPKPAVSPVPSVPPPVARAISRPVAPSTLPSPSASTPVSTPSPITPPMMAYPPVELNVKQILNDSDDYLNKLVKTTGSLQAVDTDKKTFDLRQGDLVVPIQYDSVPDSTKILLSTTSATGRDVIVTGVLRRDENLNAAYIVAQSIILR